jgi:hypothetical protein
VQVPCDEGVAIHIGPESCAVAREDSTVEQRTLTPSILVRIQVPQPNRPLLPNRPQGCRASQHPWRRDNDGRGPRMKGGAISARLDDANDDRAFTTGILRRTARKSPKQAPARRHCSTGAVSTRSARLTHMKKLLDLQGLFWCTNQVQNIAPKWRGHSELDVSHRRSNAARLDLASENSL